MGDVAKGLAKEAGELRRAHLARSERELPVLDRSEPADAAVDLHIVRRVGEDEVCPRPIHQCLEVDLASRVTAKQTVAPGAPEITLARSRRAAGECDCIVRPVGTVGISLARLLDGEVDLRQAEPSQLDIEVEGDQRLQLDCKDLLVPACIERELIVGQHVGAPLGFGEMGKSDGRHCLPAKQLRRFDPSVTRHDLAVVRNEHGVCEPEPLDRGSDPPDLLFGMGARVARVRAQRGDRPLPDLRSAHVRDPEA